MFQRQISSVLQDLNILIKYMLLLLSLYIYFFIYIFNLSFCSSSCCTSLTRCRKHLHTVLLHLSSPPLPPPSSRPPLDIQTRSRCHHSLLAGAFDTFPSGASPAHTCMLATGSHTAACRAPTCGLHRSEPHTHTHTRWVSNGMKPEPCQTTRLQVIPFFFFFPHRYSGPI